MAITLITTVGGSTSTSYASATEFDTFLTTRRGSTTVAALTADQKAIGLLEAMEFLEFLKWEGARAATTQALAHPRYGLPQFDTNFDGYGVDGYAGIYGYGDRAYYATDAIAVPVKKAQCEMAFLILNSQYNADAALSATATAIEMDGLKKTFANGGQSAAQSGQIPPSVARLLSGMLCGRKFQRA